MILNYSQREFFMSHNIATKKISYRTRNKGLNGTKDSSKLYHVVYSTSFKRVWKQWISCLDNAATAVLKIARRNFFFLALKSILNKSPTLTLLFLIYNSQYKTCILTHISSMHLCNRRNTWTLSCVIQHS